MVARSDGEAIRAKDTALEGDILYEASSLTASWLRHLRTLEEHEACFKIIYMLTMAPERTTSPSSAPSVTSRLYPTLTIIHEEQG